MLQSTQSAKNNAVKDHKEKIYEVRVPQHSSNRELYRAAGSHLSTLDTIRAIIADKKLSNTEKVKAITDLFSKRSPSSTCSETREKLLALENESTRIINNDDYYDMLESRSVPLQSRASEIIKNIEFDQSTSNPRLFEAITYYKRKDGKLENKSPVDFLDKEEQNILTDKKGKIRVSLYKILLFQYVADSIKS